VFFLDLEAKMNKITYYCDFCGKKIGVSSYKKDYLMTLYYEFENKTWCFKCFQKENITLKNVFEILDIENWIFASKK
jgi:hypothetical protein